MRAGDLDQFEPTPFQAFDDGGAVSLHGGILGIAGGLGKRLCVIMCVLAIESTEMFGGVILDIVPKLSSTCAGLFRTIPCYIEAGTVHE